MTIDIPEDVAQRLEQLAEKHDTDLGDLLRDMIERYAKERTANDKPWATLADLARNAEEAGLASPHSVNTAARSREILNAEYADYLKRRRSR
ncbi:MAG: ribbon-helix-helix protein, CopG family [Chloroflexi bacterium]|nr:ribbon-helix-helix protein, CopG family [Chloroflexota bacterium]